MHIGIFGNAGSWYVADLTRAAGAGRHVVTRLEFPQITATVIGSRNNLQGGEADGPRRELSQFDALIVRTMPPGSLEQVVFRMDALAQAESLGVTVLNPPRSLECAVDKYLTTAKLAAAGLPVPRTIVCEDADLAMDAFSQLDGDVVVKPLFGSEGRGIVRVTDPDVAWRTFRTLARLNTVLYLQEFIPHEGYDTRVLLFDGEVIGSVQRFSEDFRTNVARQAKAVAYTPTDTEVDQAQRATTAVGARFAGVDLLTARDGQACVIEVNAVPGWRALAKATGVDVASEVIRRLPKTL